MKKEEIAATLHTKIIDNKHHFGYNRAIWQECLGGVKAMPHIKCTQCEFQTALWLTHYDPKRNEGLIRCQNCRTLMRVKIEEVKEMEPKIDEAIKSGK